MNIIHITMSFLMGGYTILLVQKLYINSLNRKSKKYFLDLYNNTALIKFIKRINNYAYFEFRNWEVIFIIDRQEIQIFEKECCLATSSIFKNDKLINDLINHIKTFWGVDIENVIKVNDIIVSKNFIEEQVREQRKMISNMFNIPFVIDEKEKEIEFTVDSILDKINLVGYNGLTKEEQEFLKNASK